jgi:hypothetical protein
MIIRTSDCVYNGKPGKNSDLPILYCTLEIFLNGIFHWHGEIYSICEHYIVFIIIGIYSYIVNFIIGILWLLEYIVILLILLFEYYDYWNI